MYLCHKYTQQSMGGIAQAFGRKHPSVSNAIQLVERQILERAPMRYQLEALVERLDEIPRKP